jgi:drug/metabolite transporter (DMT)-like permease
MGWGMERKANVNWIVYAMCTALALAVADFLVKLTVNHLSNTIAMLLYGSCTFLFGLAWVLWQHIHHVPQYVRPLGILTGIGAGVAFSLATLGLYSTFGAGAPISLASPTVRLGGLILASLAGLLLLREPLTRRYVLGMLLAVSGVILIVTE